MGEAERDEADGNDGNEEQTGKSADEKGEESKSEGQSELLWPEAGDFRRKS
jgi:hypothetical protein